MAKAKEQQEDTVPKTQATRHYLRVVAFVVLGACLGALLMLQAYPYLEVERMPTIAEPSTQEPTSTPHALNRALPTRIQIPKIYVDTTFESPLDLNADQTISVPESYEQVGWYKLGAAPGEIGTAAVLGHVDSYQGPAVFFSLGQLAPGDSIFITRADGTEAEFVVEYLERYKQEEFPTEKVYAPTDYASLRLITCTGIYEKGKQRYTHNLVVYAELKR